MQPLPPFSSITSYQYQVSNPYYGCQNGKQERPITAMEDYESWEENIAQAISKIQISENDTIHSLNEQLQTLRLERLLSFNPIDLFAEMCPGFQNNPKSALGRLSQNQVEAIIAEIANMKLSLWERFAICKIIFDNSSCFNDEVICYLGKLGIIEEISSIQDLQTRATLCNRVNNLGPWALGFLRNIFVQVGFLAEIQSQKDLSSKLSLSHFLAQQGGWAAYAMSSYFDRLGLEAAELEDVTSLVDKIASQGMVGAIGVLENFDKIPLRGLALPDRLNLLEKVALPLPNNDTLFGAYFQKLNLLEELKKRANTRERFDLCMKIASIHPSLAGAMVNNFQHLGLNFVDAKSRFTFYRHVVLSGYEGRARFSSKINNLCFVGIGASELMSLWNGLFAQDEWDVRLKNNISHYIADSLDSLGIEKVSLEERLPLYKKIAGKDITTILKLINCITSSSTIRKSEKLLIIAELCKQNNQPESEVELMIT